MNFTHILVTHFYIERMHIMIKKIDLFLLHRFFSSYIFAN